MKEIIKSLRWTAPIFDILLSPLTLLASGWFRIAKFWGLKKMPISNAIFLKLGVLPVVDHYYEPLFDFKKLPKLPRKMEQLPGLDLNVPEQLKLLESFPYKDELMKLPLKGEGTSYYYYHNESFQSGDAELYYSLIRRLRPKRVIEIGSGFSTLLAIEAIRANSSEGYSTELSCVEPYEMPWLESHPVKVVRKRVEELGTGFFVDLDENDILFIDSSHVIRPGGDVVFIILNLLPALRKGVWIHFHDIFTPADYPVEWLKDEYRLWNEQYLLEAFLSNNSGFEVKCSLNYLTKKHWSSVKATFPVLAAATDREPGSFWIQKCR